MPLAELRSEVERRAAAASPAQALALARLLRVLALRERDSAVLRRAGRLLTRARGEGGEPGCRAGLELARLEARDRWHAAKARQLARGVVEEFTSLGEAAVCVAEARRMLAVLAGLPREVSNEGGAQARLEAVDVLGSEQGAGGVRIILRTSAPVEMQRERRVEGESSTITLRFSSLALPPELSGERAVVAGGLRSLRVAPSGPGAEVTLGLDPGAEVGVFALGDPARIVLDVAPHRPTEVASPSGPPRLVVLDPGHGGDDWGARYQGLEESDLVLDIAARAQRSLSALLPSTRVLLTRREDRFLSLPARTAMANALAADLFVSIHLNSADEQVTHGGVTTFVLDTGNERQALRLAARENGTRTSEVGELSRVIAHLYRREQLAASRALAEQVHAATLGAARRSLPRLPDRGVQRAMFHVLVGARMPAVLVEASFLTEPREAAALRTPAYRQALADGIARGIARFALRGVEQRRPRRGAFAPPVRGSHTSPP